jgi:hypothetical protein
MTRSILRCARVGSSLISASPIGTVVRPCERCAHDIHMTPASFEKIKRKASLYVVICDECVRDPQLPVFLAERGVN